ncbi:uncharacterized protein BJ171DRAFT_89316 [Polychytrium aggregatum]|uniref:uncharacterized protein n=1 Tax=Polychytrium aggregatum TaxID=110093 RepID=UPI0022FEE45C|nr:uncharacterized protein BJ171DRAFT_89316 [Polychytrium aggregatum]KAI9204762.1 hypothetical protein BJ171DRAFT_89316 [Polychytrium aggregatum]
MPLSQPSASRLWLSFLAWRQSTRTSSRSFPKMGGSVLFSLTSMAGHLFPTPREPSSAMFLTGPRNSSMPTTSSRESSSSSHAGTDIQRALRHIRRSCLSGGQLPDQNCFGASSTTRVSKLLPHEVYFLQDASHAPCIRLVDCGVSVFSDWPEISHRIRTLIIDNSTNEVTDFSGFPEMQQLESLTIRCNIATLEGMPNTLPNLTLLDLSECANIQSLNGLSRIPSVIRVRLPPLIENIEPLYQYFGQLEMLDLSRCSRITSLVGFPPLRKLNELRLPRSIQSLYRFPSQLDSLTDLNMWTCDRLMSLERRPPMPGLRNIRLPQSICLKNAVDIIHWFQQSPQWRSCSAKDRSHNVRLAFHQFWTLLSLVFIDALSEANLSNQCLNVHMEEPSELLDHFLRTSGDENFNELIGDTRTAMDISAGLNIQLLGIDRGRTYIGCYALDYDSMLSVLEIPTGLVNWKSPLTKVTVHSQSLESCHRESNYILRIDQTAEKMVWRDSKAECLVGMPPRFDYIKHLEIGWNSLKSLRGMPEMHLLEKLTLRADVEDLQGLPPVLPSLMHLDISDCARLTSLKGMPEMPKLTTLILPPLIRSLQGLPRILCSLQSIDLSSCSELASLKEIPYLPNLRKLITPRGLKTLDIPLNHISSLEELHMSYSSSLESLDRFPYTPKLKILCLNGSFYNLRGLPSCMPSLQILYVLCPLLTSLEGFPASLMRLLELNLYSCTNLRSIEGLPRMPLLQKLRCSGMPQSIFDELVGPTEELIHRN